MVGWQRSTAAVRVVAKKTTSAAVGLAAVFGLWWLVSLGSQALQVPSPSAVFHAIHRDLYNIPALSYVVFQRGGLLDGLAYTLTNVLLGVALGAGVGFILGLLLARVEFVRDVLEPPLIVFGTIPILIVLPFLTLWFGTSRLAQAGLVIFYSMLSVTFVTQQAARNIAGAFEQYASSLGASRRRTFLEVILPASLPEALGGVRVALAAGWGFEAIAEVLGAQHGAGRIIQVSGTLDATADIMGVVLCVAVLGVLVDALLVLAGRWMIRWQE
jgi:ABC-type nitrate/sulfonate/bicarbonate transport system permease component